MSEVQQHNVVTGVQSTVVLGIKPVYLNHSDTDVYDLRIGVASTIAVVNWTSKITNPESMTGSAVEGAGTIKRA